MPTLAALPTRQGEVALLPGYGIRPGRDDDVRPSSLARRLVADHLADLDGVILAGHSAGCQVVVEAAVAAPHAVAAIVLVGPATDPRARSWAGLAGRWLRTAAHEPPQQAPYLARAYARVGPLNMLRTMDAARRHDLRPGLARLSCPVLVVRGPHDRICPLDWANELTGASPPGSASASLSAGAHMVPLTHGALVAEQIARFDKRL